MPSLLAGRIFTHRLTADELTHDLLTVTPDLAPVSELCNHDGYRELADGSPVQIVLPEFDDALLESREIPIDLLDSGGAALLLQPGTLAELRITTGDLVGLGLTERGLVLQRLSEAADAPAGARLADVLDPEEPARLEAAVWAACAENPALFTAALAPLGEIVDEHGLARGGEWLAPAGFDFDRWHFEQDCARLAGHYRLHPDDALAVTVLLQVCVEMAALDDDESEPEGQYGELLAKAGAALADPLLAEILAVETVGGRRMAAALGLLAETLAPRVPRSARVATRWLFAVACERLGDTEAAERELLAAEALDPDWPLPLLDLARLASDRGDAETGLGLLHRAGAEPDHPLVDPAGTTPGAAAQRHRPQRAVLVRVRPQIQEVPPR